MSSSDKDSDGTTGFTGGLAQATWPSLSLRIRLMAFAVAVGAVGLLIVGIDSNIWSAQKHLEEGFAAIKAEKFYLGLNFRTSLRKISDGLLDYYLTGNPASLDAAHQEAQRLSVLVRTKETTSQTPEERNALINLESAYTNFLAQVEPLAKKGVSTQVNREQFAAAYEHLNEQYLPVLRTCDALVDAERRGLRDFLTNSDGTLLLLQRWFLSSLILLLALAGALTFLVYRGMIAPLKAQLIESHALLERQEKLASLGVLGAGVAHEIRNPLTALKFRLFSLKESLPPSFAENEDARTITEEINRLDHIVTDFLKFARPSDPDLVRLPAERILEEVQDLMKPALQQSSIDLKVDILQPAWILADPHQLKQVLINLIQNAADSIETRGVVSIRLRRGVAALGGEARSVTLLSVSDTGKGIPKDVQKRLFDPFFTTKEDGTGLGLAIAARIVEKHGGRLRYKTEINRGTTFEIVLPNQEEDATKNIAGRR